MNAEVRKDIIYYAISQLQRSWFYIVLSGKVKLAEPTQDRKSKTSMMVVEIVILDTSIPNKTKLNVKSTKIRTAKYKTSMMVEVTVILDTSNPKKTKLNVKSTPK